MDFELTDGNKFFKVAWHNTSRGMKLMLLMKVVSLPLKQNRNPNASLRRLPVLSYQVAQLGGREAAPGKAYPCFGAEGRRRDRAERPVRKHTFLLLLLLLLLPAGRPARSPSSGAPGEDGGSPAGDVRRRSGKNVAGKGMARGGYADVWPPDRGRV